MSYLVVKDGTLMVDPTGASLLVSETDPAEGDCCCGGNPCTDCYEGGFTLAVTISSLTGCAADWNGVYNLPFSQVSGHCNASGFTIINACGSMLAGIQGLWDGTVLTITIADISGTIYRWAGNVTCSQIAAGVALPNVVEGTGGPGICVVDGP